MCDIHHYNKSGTRFSQPSWRQIYSGREQEHNSILRTVLFKHRELYPSTGALYFHTYELLTRLLNNKRFDDRTKNDLVNMISIIKIHHHFGFYILLVFYLVVIFFFLKYCLSVMHLIQLLRLLYVQIIHLQIGNHIR